MVEQRGEQHVGQGGDAAANWLCGTPQLAAAGPKVAALLGCRALMTEGCLAGVDCVRRVILSVVGCASCAGGRVSGSGMLKHACSRVLRSWVCIWGWAAAIQQLWQDGTAWLRVKELRNHSAAGSRIQCTGCETVTCAASLIPHTLP